MADRNRLISLLLTIDGAAGGNRRLSASWAFEMADELLAAGVRVGDPNEVSNLASSAPRSEDATPLRPSVCECGPVCAACGRDRSEGAARETAWVSPAVTRRAEIAERKALAGLLGEAWLAHDLANDAFLAEDVPRPTVAEYAGFVADIAARLLAANVRVGDAGLPITTELAHDLRVAGWSEDVIARLRLAALATPAHEEPNHD